VIMMLAVDNSEDLDPRNLIQGSEEWKAARLGKATASRIIDIITRTKNGWGYKRAKYMKQLIIERLTNAPVRSFSGGQVAWGKDTEEEAISAYAFETGFDVEPIGFVPHPRIALAGASPDGVVSAGGLVQIKCPGTETHVDTLFSQEVPEEHIPQIQFEMACTGHPWNDFVSYDPCVPVPMRIFLRRVERDDLMIAQLEVMVKEFLAELVGKITDLEQLYCGGPSRLLAELRESI
jgi:hypothetical protein